MPVTSFASGTKTVNTLGTSYTLASVNQSGVYVLLFDCAPMVAGDVVELRAEKIALTSGTKRGEIVGTFYGVQPTDDTMKQSLPIPNDLTDTDSIKFSLKQTFGTTSHGYPFTVLKIA